jgi:hypothetical protein
MSGPDALVRYPSDRRGGAFAEQSSLPPHPDRAISKLPTKDTNPIWVFFVLSSVPPIDRSVAIKVAVFKFDIVIKESRTRTPVLRLRTNLAVDFRLYSLVPKLDPGTCLNY